jgi:serine/threonine-protein kinase PknG
VDAGDPQANWLSTVSVIDPAQRLSALKEAPSMSIEVRLAVCYAALHLGRGALVDEQVSALLNEDPWEWRAVWMSGLDALRRADTAAARAAMNAVYGQVPGELAPKLALAMACERSGEPAVAEALYITCARTDAAYLAPSAFGIERIRREGGDLDGAIGAMDLIPPTSRAFTLARRMRAGLLAGSGRGLNALADALGSIRTVTIEPQDRSTLVAEVYAEALKIVKEKGPEPALKIGARAATERELRDGLELSYRELAVYAPTHAEKVRLVDEANRVRRWTLR